MGTQDDPENQVLLTAKEAAEYLNLSQPTVYRLIKRGIFEVVKTQGVRERRLTLRSLDAYHNSTNMTLPEIAKRLIEVEKKIEFLLTRVNLGNEHRATEVVKTSVEDFTKLQKELHKRFPALDKKN